MPGIGSLASNAGIPCDVPTQALSQLTRKRYLELVTIAVSMANTLDSQVDKSEYCTLGRIMEQIVQLSKE